MKGHAIMFSLLAVVGWVLEVASKPTLPEDVPKDLRGYYDYFMEIKEDGVINSDLTEMISVKFANNTLKSNREVLLDDIKAIHGLLRSIFKVLLNFNYLPRHVYVHQKSPYKPMAHFGILRIVIPALYEQLVFMAGMIQSTDKRQYDKGNDVVKRWLTDSNQGFDASDINMNCDVMELQDALTELIGPTGHLTKVVEAFMSYEKTMGKLKTFNVKTVPHSDNDEAGQSESIEDDKEESILCKTENPSDIKTTIATLHAEEEFSAAETLPDVISEEGFDISWLFLVKPNIPMKPCPVGINIKPEESDYDSLSTIPEEYGDGSLNMTPEEYDDNSVSTFTEDSGDESLTTSTTGETVNPEAVVTSSTTGETVNLEPVTTATITDAVNPEPASSTTGDVVPLMVEGATGETVNPEAVSTSSTMENVANPDAATSSTGETVNLEHVATATITDAVNPDAATSSTGDVVPLMVEGATGETVNPEPVVSTSSTGETVNPDTASSSSGETVNLEHVTTATITDAVNPDAATSSTGETVNPEPVVKLQEEDIGISWFFQNLDVPMMPFPEALSTLPEGKLDTSWSPSQPKDTPEPQLPPAKTIGVKVLPTASDEVPTKHDEEPLITRQNVDVANLSNEDNHSSKKPEVKETSEAIVLPKKAHLTINGVKKTLYPIPGHKTVETKPTAQMTPESIEEFAKEITDPTSSGAKETDATKDGSKMTASSGSSISVGKKHPDTFIPITTIIVTVSFLLLV